MNSGGTGKRKILGGKSLLASIALIAVIYAALVILVELLEVNSSIHGLLSRHESWPVSQVLLLLLFLVVSLGILASRWKIQKRRESAARAAAEERAEQLQSVIESTTDFIATLSADGDIIHHNQAGGRLGDILANSSRPMANVADIFTEESIIEILDLGMPLAAREGAWHGETVIAGDGRSRIPVSQLILAHRDESGKVEYYSTICRDISEQKQHEEQLRSLSLVDELTGLHNRRGFLQIAEQQLWLARREHRRMLILFADLDDLKWINDNLGHAAGDMALVRAAEVIRQTFRESDLIARIGGDEFVALAPESHRSDAMSITARLKQKLDEVNSKRENDFSLSLSLGFSYFDPDNPMPLEDLLNHADKRMYLDKKAGRRSSA